MLFVVLLAPALLAAQTSGPPPERAIWELLLVTMGGVTTAAAFLALVWRIMRPHVDRYVRSLVSPVRSAVDEVRDEVTAHGAGPSITEQTEELARTLESVTGLLHKLSRNVQRVDGRAQITQSVLGQHVAESRVYLEGMRDVLRQHDIELPDPGTRRTDEE